MQSPVLDGKLTGRVLSGGSSTEQQTASGKTVKNQSLASFLQGVCSIPHNNKLTARRQHQTALEGVLMHAHSFQSPLQLTERPSLTLETMV